MSLRSYRLLAAFLLLGSFVSGQSSHLVNPFLQDSTHLFTAKLTYKENTFNGYLGVKYSGPENFRVSFNSTMGSTLMDLEWKNGEFITHYIPEKLNRGIVINKLRDDFELMFLHILAEGKWKNDSTLKVDCGKYRVSQTDQGLPLNILHRNWLGFLKRTLSFGYKEEALLHTVSLKHHSFALHMHLITIE